MSPKPSKRTVSFANSATQAGQEQQQQQQEREPGGSPLTQVVKEEEEVEAAGSPVLQAECDKSFVAGGVVEIDDDEDGDTVRNDSGSQRVFVYGEPDGRPIRVASYSGALQRVPRSEKKRGRDSIEE
ncbi:hypothetical protein BGX27_006758, partial [Mortierella sp. AM989]